MSGWVWLGVGAAALGGLGAAAYWASTRERPKQPAPQATPPAAAYASTPSQVEQAQARGTGDALAQVGAAAEAVTSFFASKLSSGFQG
jgi:uncharacterized membrane protein YebE (DUF533 family)